MGINILGTRESRGWNKRKSLLFSRRESFPPAILGWIFSVIATTSPIGCTQNFPNGRSNSSSGVISKILCAIPQVELFFFFFSFLHGLLVDESCFCVSFSVFFSFRRP